MARGSHLRWPATSLTNHPVTSVRSQADEPEEDLRVAPLCAWLVPRAVYHPPLFRRFADSPRKGRSALKGRPMPDEDKGCAHAGS